MTLRRLQMSLAPFGLPLFAGDAIMTDRSFTLFHCLNAYKSDGLIRFVDDHISRTLDVRLLLPPSGIISQSHARMSRRVTLSGIFTGGLRGVQYCSDVAVL